MDAQYEKIISHLNDIINKKDELIKEKDLYINQLKEEISQLKFNLNNPSNNFKNKTNSELKPGINCLSNPPSHIKKDDGSLSIKSARQFTVWDATDLSLDSIGGVPASYLYPCIITPATSGATSFEVVVEVDLHLLDQRKKLGLVV
jgi:hypothetical protein